MTDKEMDSSIIHYLEDHIIPTEYVRFYEPSIHADDTQMLIDKLRHNIIKQIMTTMIDENQFVDENIITKVFDSVVHDQFFIDIINSLKSTHHIIEDISSNDYLFEITSEGYIPVT